VDEWCTHFEVALACMHFWNSRRGRVRFPTMKMNTKQLGDVGLGKAIAYFTSQGYTVSIPLTDSQDYDLVVGIGYGIFRVQVKATSFKRRYYEVSLTVKGGNRSSTGKIKKIDKEIVDMLYIATPDQDYVIPIEFVKGNSMINLGPGYDKFKTGSIDG
jgi:hypothetical protein